MNYPVWQLGVPGGLLIAFIAVLHVFVSHFAIGGGAYLVITERKAYRENDDNLLAYVRQHSRFFALLTLVFGAVTGVGIWFTIGLVSPEATSSLIHTFVWGWAIEWVFFFIEIAAALIYAYAWDRLDRRTHLIVGWIYFIAAWASLVVINGIITYMLTPGRWLETKAFWDGFFNPTYFPSLFMRTFFTVALAGVFGLITAMELSSPTREKVIRWAGQWLILGLVLTPIAGFWYFLKFPTFSEDYIAGFLPAAQHTVRLGVTCTLFALLLTIIFAIAKPQWMKRPVMTLLFLACFGTLATGEYLREYVRKPWVINNYIYANDLRAADIQNVAMTGGIAAHARWLRVAPAANATYGQQVFALQCGSCHSVDSYRAIRPKIRGWDAKYAAGIVPNLNLTRGTMPPFAGDATDAAALGMYLASIAPPAPAQQSGAEIFQARCAQCHTIGGKMRPLAIAGSDVDSIDSILQQLDVMIPQMPPFTGTETERRALAQWLSTQK
ncbi:MAG TPA: c-type cytochrome [Terriglobales bacterium]|nr:c-type cytochrome [Terriglobales bacterium]